MRGGVPLSLSCPSLSPLASSGVGEEGQFESLQHSSPPPPQTAPLLPAWRRTDAGALQNKQTILAALPDAKVMLRLAVRQGAWPLTPRGLRIPLSLAVLQEEGAVLALQASTRRDPVAALVLVSPVEMAQYNRTFRQIDKPTDVLSFPALDVFRAKDEMVYRQPDLQRDLGTVVLCLPYIRKWCMRHGVCFYHRLDEILVHGMCHLVGHDHIEDADYEKMAAEEARLLVALDRFRQERAAGRNHRVN